MIVTFYSFKGGVGRSMALANVAEILAERNYRVIVCDWDLEAPGLERYLTDTDQQAAELTGRKGIVDLIQDYKATLSGAPPDDDQNSGDFVDVNGLLVRNPASFAEPTSPGSRIRLLSAGRRAGEYLSQYTQAVQGFSWSDFYENWAGGSYIELFRKSLDSPEQADIVILDSRTGVTEQGGVCTHHLADLVIVITAPNDLNLNGAEWMLQTLSKREGSALRQGRRLGALPVASRVEQLSERDLTKDFRRKFQERFGQYVPSELRLPQFLLESEIPHVAAFGFTERVVAREKDRHLEKQVFGAYSQIADAIVRWGGQYCNLRSAESGFASNRSIRVALSFAAAQSEAGMALAAELEREGLQVARLGVDDQPPRKILETVDAALLVAGPASEPLPFSSDVREILLRKAIEPAFCVAMVPAQGQEAALLPYLPRLLLNTGALWSERLKRLAQEQTSPKVVTKMAVSFCGLRPYQEGEGWCFFRRDPDVLELTRAVGPGKLIVLRGDSGSGKTSLIHAGLFPEIRRAGEWKIICKDAKAGSTSLIKEITGVLKAAATNRQRTLIVLDQFERIGDSVTPETLQVILTALGDPAESTACLIVITGPVDARAFSVATERAQILELKKVARERLAALTTDLLNSQGVKVERGLVDRIAADIDESPCSLALLQHCLTALWQSSRDATLGIDVYEAAGGFPGLLQNRAEAVVYGLPTEEENLARRILTRLVQPGDGGVDVRRTGSLGEILGIGSNRTLTKTVFGKLVEGRIVAIRSGEGTGEPAVELSHPALVEKWTRLRKWLNEDRHELRIELELASAAQDWHSYSRKSAYLLRGAKLAQAREWSEKHLDNLRPLEQEFLNRSIRNQWPRIAAIVGGSALAGVLLVMLAFSQRGRLYDWSLIKPLRFTGAFNEEFPRTDDGFADQRKWTYRERTWKIEAGENYDPADGALVASGPRIGLSRTFVPFTNHGLYDFSAITKLRCCSTTSAAAFLVRVQADAERGYLFELKRSGANLLLSAFVLTPDAKRLGEPVTVSHGPGVQGDGYKIELNVSEFRFAGSFVLENFETVTPDREIGVPKRFEFSDPGSNYRWGNIGFREGEAAAPSRPGSPTVVEYFRVLEAK